MPCTMESLHGVKVTVTNDIPKRYSRELNDIPKA